MSAGHAYELPVGQPALEGALAEVEAGEVAYLTRAGRAVAALAPVPEFEELQAVADAAALSMLHRAKAQPGPRIPHEVVEAMMAADDALHDAMAAALDARAHEDLSADEVTALWERISGAYR